MTAEPNSFTSFQNVRASRVYRLPDGMTLEDGAATTGVFNTAHHALVNLARIRPGGCISSEGGVDDAA